MNGWKRRTIRLQTHPSPMSDLVESEATPTPSDAGSGGHYGYVDVCAVSTTVLDRVSDLTGVIGKVLDALETANTRKEAT